MLIALIAGVGGTGLGAVLVVIGGKPKGAVLSMMLGFSAGIMLAIVSLELIPEALQQSGKSPMLCGFLLGIIVMLLADLLIEHLHMTETDAGADIHRLKMEKIGWFLTAGITLHNLPEGLAIGASFAVDRTLGLVIALMIGLHNVPEGVALAAPVYAAEESRKKTILRSIFAGAPMTVGALLGFLFGRVSREFLGIGLGFAAGAMFFIICDELIPITHMESERYGHIPILSIVVGFTTGVILSFINP